MSHSPTFLADVGNSRLKVVRRNADGSLGPVLSLSIDEPDGWPMRLHAAGLLEPAACWSISTVRPAASEALLRLLQQHSIHAIDVYRSAADVPVRHRLRQPDRTGADRALAVFEALSKIDDDDRGLGVIQCGTAITVEHIDESRIWRGGAIAPGLGPMSEALSRLTAQLPRIDTKLQSQPRKYADHTEGALEAGLYWSLVGAIRELTGMRDDHHGIPRTTWIWTGGDAEWLAPLVAGPEAWVEPDLVLQGLARLAGSTLP